MWKRITSWFKYSETIFLARVQIGLGTVLGVLANTEPALFSNLTGAKWFPLFLVGHGVLVEYLRKRRDDEMK